MSLSISNLTAKLWPEIVLDAKRCLLREELEELKALDLLMHDRHMGIIVGREKASEFINYLLEILSGYEAKVANDDHLDVIQVVGGWKALLKSAEALERIGWPAAVKVTAPAPRVKNKPRHKEEPEPIAVGDKVRHKRTRKIAYVEMVDGKVSGVIKLDRMLDGFYWQYRNELTRLGPGPGPTLPQD